MRVNNSRNFAIRLDSWEGIQGKLYSKEKKNNPNNVYGLEQLFRWRRLVKNWLLRFFFASGKVRFIDMMYGVTIEVRLPTMFKPKPCEKGSKFQQTLKGSKITENYGKKPPAQKQDQAPPENENEQQLDGSE